MKLIYDIEGLIEESSETFKLLDSNELLLSTTVGALEDYDSFPDEVPDNKALLWMVQDIKSEIIGSGHFAYDGFSIKSRMAVIITQFQGIGMYQSVLFLLNQRYNIESDTSSNGRLTSTAKRVWETLGAVESDGSYRLKKGQANQPKYLEYF